MDFEKIAEASHQAWFVAMAKQGWIFGPRLNPDFKTHPWLKPYGGLSDTTKEIVRAQLRGTLAALEGQGYVPGSGAVVPPPKAPPAPTPRPAETSAPSAPPARPSAPPPPPPAPMAAPAQQAASAARSSVVEEVLERKIDTSGRMRIGSGLVKKAELLPGNATQVAIVQRGDAIEVLPYDATMPDAFFASVNPDGFMLPKAMLSGTGASDFTLTISPGRLVVRPK
ncbi:MAG: RyR protein [Cyanobacteria bacterium RYN_339]|nr:RyR protein [Cyanobacteria bacterium RYN_339]